jgi:hypothetical protein
LVPVGKISLHLDPVLTEWNPQFLPPSEYLPNTGWKLIFKLGSSKGIKSLIWKLNADRITPQNWNRKNLNVNVIFVGVPNYKTLLKVICYWLKPLWEQIPFIIYRLGVYGLRYRYKVKEMKQNIVVQCVPYGEFVSFCEYFWQKGKGNIFFYF